jgi:hypothetical protein
MSLAADQLEDIDNYIKQLSKREQNSTVEVEDNSIQDDNEVDDEGNKMIFEENQTETDTEEKVRDLQHK